MVVPRLPDDADGVGLGLDEVAQRLVGVDLALHPPRRSERDEPAGGELQLLRQPPEQLVVLGVGAGPAGLDVVHAERVELLGDAELVVDRERDALELRAVAQRRVVDLDGAGQPGIVDGSCGHSRACSSHSLYWGTSPCTVAK